MSAAATEILALNAFGGRDPAALPPEVEAAVRRRQASYGAGSVLFYDEPLRVTEARGATILTADGRAYLDFYNNVPSVGHCHPKVVEAVREAVGRINVHSRYLSDDAHDYAEALLSTFPPELSNLALTCTGSESNDLALRIARLATGAEGVVVTEAAYHGNTAAVTEVSPSSYRRGGPPARVRTVPAPDPRIYGDDVGAGFAAAVEAAIAALAEDGIRPAALLVDTIFSSDGVFADPPGFLAPAVAAMRAAGGLLVADEVQPGFGRTGAGLWGFSRHGIVPDIVTMGKPMGNGYPVAGLVTRPDLLARFYEDFGYFNTFAASPVAAAAALAVLEAIEEDGLVANAREVGAHLRSGLDDLAARHAGIAAVRGVGLYVGVEFRTEGGAPDAPTVSRLINDLCREGILIGAAGRHGDTLKLRPPLCVTKADADRLVETLDRVM